MSDSKEFDYTMLRSFLLGEGFEIYDVDEQDPYDDGLMEGFSWCAGKELHIGVYENIQHRILALAHEAGHHYSAYNRMHKFFDFKHPDMRIEHHGLFNEAMAWQAAFELLADLKIELDEECLQYPAECLESYMGYKG